MKIWLVVMFNVVAWSVQCQLSSKTPWSVDFALGLLLFDARGDLAPSSSVAGELRLGARYTGRLAEGLKVSGGLGYAGIVTDGGVTVFSSFSDDSRIDIHYGYMCYGLAYRWRSHLAPFLDLRHYFHFGARYEAYHQQSWTAADVGIVYNPEKNVSWRFSLPISLTPVVVGPYTQRLTGPPPRPVYRDVMQFIGGQVAVNVKI